MSHHDAPRIHLANKANIRCPHAARFNYQTALAHNVEKRDAAALTLKKVKHNESFISGIGTLRCQQPGHGRRIANQSGCSTSRVEQYTYGTHLDIARVISISQIPSVCEVVPARMVYEDSQGARHTMSYQVMGNGCSNG